MSFEGFKPEMDNQSDVAAKSLKDNKDTNDTSQNPDATQGLDKNPTKNVDFFKITPEQQQVAEAGHDKYVQLSAQGAIESHQSKTEAAGALSEAIQSNIDWI